MPGGVLRGGRLRDGPPRPRDPQARKARPQRLPSSPLLWVLSCRNKKVPPPAGSPAHETTQARTTRPKQKTHCRPEEGPARREDPLPPDSHPVTRRAACREGSLGEGGFETGHPGHGTTQPRKHAPGRNIHTQTKKDTRHPPGHLVSHISHPKRITPPSAPPPPADPGRWTCRRWTG